jgi:hypothetical protein
MKKALLILGGSVIAAVTQATLFTTTVFTTGADDIVNPNVGESFSVSGDSFIASFTNATLSAPRTYLDITWHHSFDTTQATANSPAVPLGYSAVTNIVTGRVRRVSGSGNATFSASLTETVLDKNGTLKGATNPVLDYNSSNSGQFENFRMEVTTPFANALTQGTVQKNNLFFNADAGVEVVIDQFEQKYTPVPEPVSMVALAIGGVGLLTRKRRKN